MAGIYTRYFVRSLKGKVRAKEETLADLIDLEAVWSSSTIRQFDNTATAPLHGFVDAEDYYHKCSSNRFISAIRTPTLLVHFSRRSVPSMGRCSRPRSGGQSPFDPRRH